MKGFSVIIAGGEQKNTKSSIQFLTGYMFRACKIDIMASAMLPKTPPELDALKGALWSI